MRDNRVEWDRAARGRSRCAGFGLVEGLIGVTVLAFAVIGYVSATLSQQRLAAEGTTRSRVHQVARHFMERLAADPEWPTLYARLRALQVQAETVDPTSAVLRGGRGAFPLSTYYADLLVPSEVGSLLVLVDVPHARPDPDDDANASDVLREDLSDPTFALPADLNGDGVLDSATRDDDCVALPVVVTFTWTPRGESSRELRFTTGLRGDR